MADIAIFRINYKSDFVLTLNSDAGWMTPFCIKFWTGAPSQAYFAGYDGTTYTHCAPVDGEPTKLRVQFDDHHLPIGDLKFQIAYHFTVDDFPTSIEDEVLNQASVIIEVDDAPAQVMLDLNGETAPEIEFSLPAYANEAQRIANEEQRIADEDARIQNEETRISAEQVRQQNETQRISREQARQSNEAQRIEREQARQTNEAQRIEREQARQTNEELRIEREQARQTNEDSRIQREQIRQEHEAQRIANETERVTEFAEIKTEAVAATNAANAAASLANEKAAYAKAEGDYAKAQGDYAKGQGAIAEEDHVRAESDHTRAEQDHATAATDHTQAGSDHTRAEDDHSTASADHTTATDDHTQAVTDHTTASSDHTQAGNDHTRAESDHTRAESDHAAVEVYVDSLGVFDLSKHNAVGGVLATYSDLSAALTALNALESKYKYGGMTFKFVQSSDNKYVQYRLMADEFSTDVEDWEHAASVEALENGDVVPAIAGNLGYGICTTGTYDAAKTVNIPHFMLFTNGTINVLFTTPINTENATLNVSLTGAKPIRILGQNLPAGVIKAETYATLAYDGTAWNIVNLFCPDASFDPAALVVDMGLPSGVKWASRDIDLTKQGGFCETPFIYEKSFFSWGNIDGHNPSSVSAFAYDWGGVNAQAPWYEGQPYGSTSGNTLTGGIAVGEDFDAARANLGAPWRMPTSAEYNELFANIKYINADGTEVDTTNVDKRVSVNGILGLYIESRINGARLFFSCSGSGFGRSWNNRGAFGDYWSSTWFSARSARQLRCYSGGVLPNNDNGRLLGFAVRPVQ